MQNSYTTINSLKFAVEEDEHKPEARSQKDYVTAGYKHVKLNQRYCFRDFPKMFSQACFPLTTRLSLTMH